MASILCDIVSDRLGSKEDIKNLVMEAESQRKSKSEQKKIRDDDYRLKGLDNCEVLVRSVLAFGMDHINNIKVKDHRVLPCNQFGSKKLKGVPKKVVLVETVKKNWIGTVLCRDGGVEWLL